ncbi:class I SAM-dependent methyltransferase [Paenibacillus sp. M1]|uniref:Class I SAM-dependent methyltransferase n=1 Tax=Paenibacillus haidiansis TaxID=1574488 RepID=A0ABU7VVG7_9BACL
MDIQEQIKNWERKEGVSLFDRLGLPEEAAVLDYGCGFGHYTFALSRALHGRGTVYAVDINPACLDSVRQTASEERLENIHVRPGNRDYTLDFSERCLDLILYYDILHGDGLHRFTLYKEAARTLKSDGILSVLPFHLTSFRDTERGKRSFTYSILIEEIEKFGFRKISGPPLKGIHFEKVHSPHYMRQGGVELGSLERGEILNFVKN